MTQASAALPEIRRVVVGFDFGEPSLAAARWVARRLAPKAEIVLVHSVYVPQPPRFLRGMFPSPEHLTENAERGAQARMRELGPSVGAERMWTEIRSGRPAVAIAEVAAETTADLIVVGPHGERSGLWKLLGSTAHELLERSACPVLMVRGLVDAPPRRVLVPIDDSPAAARALAWGTALCRAHGAKLVVVHIISPTLSGAIEIGGTERERRHAAEMLEKSAREWASQTVESCPADDDEVEVEVAHGDPGFEILAAAKAHDSDLIVMGRRGAGGTRLVLGGTTDFILRSGISSVLVVSGD